ncbi:oligouridylate-binding protein 1-like [Triticum urartu]|uniref:oligouridylate-binding protein 1-like n=1 Tax=Triticum urartu TaxID=4572 RepID=UPI0020446035|nr:oligouridylate-binding protein 1-like [Triticum urartu]
MLPQQSQAAAMMQQAAAMQSMYAMPPPPHHHHLLGAAPPQQIEPILTGNLPPGFDTSTCRSVYVGNIHVQVTEALLREVFQSAGSVDGCKLIRKEKSSYGFVDYYERGSAALAIFTLNGKQIFGQPIRVNWAYASGQREDTTDHFHIFVGDLSPEVTDSALFAFFSAYSPNCSDARVMWDQKTGRSRGYGFVSFRNQQDAQSAINDLNGEWLGNRQIRCNWATKGANSGEDQLTSDSKSIADVNNNFTENAKQKSNEDAPENNPLYRTVYVGNLAHEVTQDVLHRFFHALGAGAIEEVRVQHGKGFGFVKYSNHAETALAIQTGNGRILGGKPVKCSWGNKPTPPGTTSAPLPPPAAPSHPAAADLVAYQRAIAMSKMASTQALMQAQHLRQAAMGMGVGASQAMYDGTFQNVGTSQQQQQQQLMYY